MYGITRDVYTLFFVASYAQCCLRDLFMMWYVAIVYFYCCIAAHSVTFHKRFIHLLLMGIWDISSLGLL